MGFLNEPTVALALTGILWWIDTASPRSIYHAFKNAVSDLPVDFEEIWIPCGDGSESVRSVTLWDKSEHGDVSTQPVDQSGKGNPPSSAEKPEAQEECHRFCSHRTAGNKQSIINESCELKPISGIPETKTSTKSTNFLRSLSSKMSFREGEIYDLDTFEIFEPEVPHGETQLPPQSRSRRDGTAAIVVRAQHYLAFQISADQRLKAIVSCKTLVEEKDHEANLSGQASKAMDTFFTHLENLDEFYRDLRKPDILRIAFMLQYHHAQLITFAGFLLKFERAYLNVHRIQYDPRKFRLKQWHSQRITEDSVALEKYNSLGKEISERLETLMDIIRLTTNPEEHLSQAEVKVRILKREVSGLISRMRDGVEHDLKFLNLGRDMAQTSSVRQLTLLATIFLPLSLSAGVLSMQTRFKDLGPLLYDFIGVVVLLGALVFPFLAFLSILELITDYLVQKAEAEIFEGQEGQEKFRIYTYKRLRRYFVRIFWAVLALVAVFVFLTFMLGMFRNVELGAKVLGIGFAVLIALTVLIAVFSRLGILCFRCIMSRLRPNRGQMD